MQPHIGTTATQSAMTAITEMTFATNPSLIYTTARKPPTTKITGLRTEATFPASAALDHAAEAFKDGAALAGGVPVSDGAVDSAKSAAARYPSSHKQQPGSLSLFIPTLFWIQKILQVNDLLIAFCSAAQRSG